MEEVSSVSQLNHYIKNLFARDYHLDHICVKGEVSNCKYHSSGHIYFTLKDVHSAISCIMFSSLRAGLKFHLEEGQSVIVTGRVGVYEQGGKYQLYANTVIRDGVGQLYEKFELCKKKLEREGIFDSSRKKNIPKYAQKIGIVTAETGAVIQDICNVAARRNPYVQLYLYPAKVQGDGAAQNVIAGLRYFEHTDVDTVIIGRGGGSIEDLWAFNEEDLAREIAACKKPIISAVGHETDTTIADFAADLRAPTPSAAAELAVYPVRDIVLTWKTAQQEMIYLQQSRVKRYQMRLVQYLTILQKYSPQDSIAQRRMQLVDMQQRYEHLLEKKLTAAKHQLALYAEELKGVSPLYKLQGGYSYVSDEAGHPVSQAAKLFPKQSLHIAFQDGTAKVRVEKVEKENFEERMKK